MKFCVRCNKEKKDFPRNSKSKDGLSSWCNDCHREYMRDRKGDPVKRRKAAKKSAKKYPERRQAREKVKDAVRSGRIPNIKTQECIDCGKPAKSYDHYLGYNKPLSVEPVCFVCHGKRSRRRGEHKTKKTGRLLDGEEWNEMPEVQS